MQAQTPKVTVNVTVSNVGLKPKAKREAAVLTDASLFALSREVAPIGIKLAMFMSVPTATVLKLKAETEDLSQAQQTVEYLKYWKQMRAGVRDRDKVVELEKAIRECGMTDVAEAFADRNKDNVELYGDWYAP